MNSVISVTEARKRFFEIIDWAKNTEGEIVIEKNGQPAVVISGAKPVVTQKDKKKILANFRKVMSKFPQETPLFQTKEWRNKESKYLKNLSEGKLRGE